MCRLWVQIASSVQYSSACCQNIVPLFVYIGEIGRCISVFKYQLFEKTDLWSVSLSGVRTEHCLFCLFSTSEINKSIMENSRFIYQEILQLVIKSVFYKAFCMCWDAFLVLSVYLAVA